MKSGLSYQRIFYDQELLDQQVREERYNTIGYPDTTFVRTVDSGIDAADENTEAESFKLAGYVEDVWQASERLILNIGGRIDYFDFNKDWHYSPRLSASYRVAPETNIRAAWGLYYQSPIYRQIAYSVASDTNTQAQKATHYILGIEHKLPLDVVSNSALTLRLEGYYKKYDDLISSTRASNGRIDYSRRNDATVLRAASISTPCSIVPDFMGG